MRNTALWWILAGAIGALALAVYVPWLQTVFQFRALSWQLALLVLGVSIASIVWFEVLERILVHVRSRPRG